MNLIRLQNYLKEGLTLEEVIKKEKDYFEEIKAKEQEELKNKSDFIKGLDKLYVKIDFNGSSYLYGQIKVIYNKITLNGFSLYIDNNRYSVEFETERYINEIWLYEKKGVKSYEFLTKEEYEVKEKFCKEFAKNLNYEFKS